MKDIAVCGIWAALVIIMIASINIAIDLNRIAQNNECRP